MKAGVTILICTYNGASRLPATLQYIGKQHIPASIPCELIVVDNLSNDNTVQLVRDEWIKYPAAPALKIVNESRPGLTYARETGFAHASYEYIILCDDDNWLSPDYVQLAFALLEQHPEIGLLGGYGQFVYEIPAPGWLKLFNIYAGGPQGPANGKVKNNYIYGAGAVLRKSAYNELLKGGFSSALTDRKGDQLSSGGDYELCYALALAGYAIWYDSRLKFKHYITAHRLTLTYYLTYIQQSSRCFSVLEPYKILLKTGSHSTNSFRWELFKSFWYHIKKTGSLLCWKVFTKKSPAQQMACKLELILLKMRLQSYRDLSVMKNNFLKAVQLQKQFKVTAGSPVLQSEVR
jgi:glycosyltransferase involved in cell wall biosynthesis